jgi:hypothetical protein
MYLVGEQGPELWRAPGNGEIVPNNRLGGMQRGGDQITQIIYGTDPWAQQEEAHRRLRRRAMLAVA